MDRLLARPGLVLTQIAFCIVLVASLVDVANAHAQLDATLKQQQTNDELVAKIDGQLDALARGTQQLAQQGNANAAKIVTALAQGGVHINAGARPPQH